MPENLTANCTRSDGWWAVTVPEMDGLHTQARTLDEVPDMVTDAAELLTGRAGFTVRVVVIQP